MAAKLHLEGLPEEAVKLGLVALRDKIKKAVKANEELERPTDDLEELDEAAKDLLDQLGYKEPEKGKKANVGEVVRDDPKQGKLPLEFKPGPRARVTCNGCGRRFGLPVGEARRKCPDCGMIQLVVSDEDGNVFRQRTLVEPPDEIRTLIVKRDTDDMPPLNPAEQKTLDAWLAEHPDFILHAELVEAGDRLADPEKPGSGNPLEILCDALIGNGCEGFTSTDTPGTALCPKCGQKWTVTLERRVGDDKPSVLVRIFDPEADEDQDEGEAA